MTTKVFPAKLSAAVICAVLYTVLQSLLMCLHDGEGRKRFEGFALVVALFDSGSFQSTAHPKSAQECLQLGAAAPHQGFFARFLD
jgi:hypothetical protein